MRPAISHHSVLLIFRLSLLQRLSSSDISPVPSLNLKPNPRGGKAKKIMSSPYKNTLRKLRKRKSSTPLNPKPIGLRRMLFLVLQKRRKGRVCRDPTPSDTPSDSDTDLVVLFTDNSTEEDDEQDADYLYCTGLFSEDHSGEDWIRCAKCFRWAHTLYAGVEEDFVCEPCQG